MRFLVVVKTFVNTLTGVSVCSQHSTDEQHVPGHLSSLRFRSARSSGSHLYVCI